MNTYKLRAWRWLNVKPVAHESLNKAIDKEEVIHFEGITRAPLFEEESRTIILVPQEACPPKPQTLLVIVVPTLLLSKLESGESVTIYNHCQCSAMTRAYSISEDIA